MKKVVAIILTVIMGFSLVGCNGEQAEKTDTLHKTISIEQNNNHNRMTAEDENYIYFYNVNKIMKMSKEDSSVETVYIFEGDNFLGIECIEYFDNAFYMIGFGKEASMGMLMATVKADGTGMKIISLGNTSLMPNFYTYDSTLYIDHYGNYKLHPETLEVEPTDISLGYQRKNADGTVFEKKLEGEYVRLYKTDTSGNTQLFLQADKSVFMNHITDYYVFYVLVDPNSFDKFELYRCDTNGSNEVFIREIALEKIREISYDNEYLYVGEYEGPIWKINKETLETVDISTIKDIDYTWQEVNNEKFFYCRGGECYYIDTVTGEKVEF